MTTTTQSKADAFVAFVANNSDTPNSVARIGNWILGAAEKTGGFPIELTVDAVKNGLTKSGVKVPGTGARPETIRAALDWLADKKLISISKGKSVGYGRYTQWVFWV